MKAIILAAGRGSRLHPYTENSPKCLTELGGMSLIDRQLATLRGAGIDDIVLATGYLDGMLRLPGTRQVNNPDWETTNMVESLFCAEAEFGDDLIVSYGDIVYQPHVLEALLSATDEISVVVDRGWRAYWEQRFADPLSDAESLIIDDDGAITDIGNPVTDIDTIQAQYIGLMRFRGGGVSDLRKTRKALGAIPRPWLDKRPVTKAYMTDLLMEMILLGIRIQGVPVDGGWLEIDTVEDYRMVTAMISDGRIGRFFDFATDPARR